MTSLISVLFVGLFCAGTSLATLSYKNVQCESWNFAYATCNVGISGNPEVVDMSVVKKDSMAGCTLGSSYGFSGSTIWVNHGCRALFNVRACSATTTIDCDSWSYAYATCNVPSTSNAEYAVLKSKRSSSACTWLSSFGLTGGSIWVDKGCRGNFLVCY